MSSSLFNVDHLVNFKTNGHIGLHCLFYPRWCCLPAKRGQGSQPEDKGLSRKGPSCRRFRPCQRLHWLRRLRNQECAFAFPQYTSLDIVPLLLTTICNLGRKARRQGRSPSRQHFFCRHQPRQGRYPEPETPVRTSRRSQRLSAYAASRER